MAIARNDEFKDAFFSSPREYQELYRKTRSPGYQNSPLEDMLGSSAFVDSARQYLPYDLGESDLFRSAVRQLDNAPGNLLGNKRSWQRNFLRQLEGLRLGGYSPVRRKEMAELLAEHPEVAAKTVQVYPKGKAPSAGARAKQIGGTLAADVMSDGLRNIWWFLNAPQALTQLTTLQSLHDAQRDIENAPRGATAAQKAEAARIKGLTDEVSLLRNRNVRLAATVPAIIAMSTGIGNIGRPAGYKAILPSETDPRRTDSPLGEVVSRYFLGRTGKLLPYEEFRKERPDVSQDEYRRYKAYMFDRKTDLNPFDDGNFNVLGALKGNLVGIHGPEVAFMGKSMPIATAIMPTLAAAAGARYGFRRGGRRMARVGGELQQMQKIENQIQDEQQRFRRYQRKNPDSWLPGTEEYALSREVGPYTAEQAESAARMKRLKIAKDEVSKKGQTDMLWEILKYGAGGAVAGGITGQGLESIRRTMGTESNT